MEEGLEAMNWMGWISRMASAVDDRMMGAAVTVLNYKNSKRKQTLLISNF